MKYKLFSAVHRCAPCRSLVQALNKELPDWLDLIDYIDADNMTTQESAIVQRTGIQSLPSLTDDNILLVKGFSPDKLKSIIRYAEEGREGVTK